MTFGEVSNNVYKVTLIDDFGRKAEATDTDLERAVSTVENFAFDIQKQISKGWNKFLYDSCILKLADKTIIEKEYNKEAFGSWHILLTDNRILLDGRDNVFNIQFYKNDWVDIKSIKLTDLTFDNFIAAIRPTQ